MFSGKFSLLDFIYFTPSCCFSFGQYKAANNTLLYENSHIIKTKMKFNCLSLSEACVSVSEILSGKKITYSTLSQFSAFSTVCAAQTKQTRQKKLSNFCNNAHHLHAFFQLLSTCHGSSCLIYIQGCPLASGRDGQGFNIPSM